MATLVLTKIVHHSTPQSGTWLHCFRAFFRGYKYTHNKADKEHEGDDAKVTMNLKIPDVKAGDRIYFWVKLDDDQNDVCSKRAEDKSRKRSFKVSSASKGKERFEENDGWNYTLHWKLN